LINCAGYPNYGDELITAHWLSQLAARAPETDVWVDTHAPGLASVLLDGLHPRARFVDTIWRLCWEAPSEEPWQVAAWVDRAVRNVGQAPRWAMATELLHNVDLVHMVGGGYLYAGWPRHVGLLAAMVASGELSGARTALTGQGIAPVAAGSESLFSGLIDKIDVVDVRDESSHRLLTDAGVSQATYTGDDAFLSMDPQAVRSAPRSEPPRFMLCAQGDLLSMEQAQLAGLILRILREWKVPTDELGVLEANPGADRQIFNLLEPHLPGARFYPFAEVWRDGFPSARNQTWLTTRFHPHLIAACSGASGAVIPVSPGYYLTKHNSLREQGSAWTVVDDFTVPPLPTEGGFEPEAVHRRHVLKMDLAERIYGPRVVSGG
jgi:polysaccharide pyruvyl transferase WcaK-like protein